MEKKALHEMEGHIDDLLMKALNELTLTSSTFYFVSTVSFYETDNKENIYPAELAIAKFSIEGGVKDSLHFYINPGLLPTGAIKVAQHLSDATHKLKIPPDPEARGISDYSVMVFKKALNFSYKNLIFQKSLQKKQIDNFIDNDSGNTVLFTNHDEFYSTQRVIHKIWKKSGSHDIPKVYKLEILLRGLKYYTLNLIGSNALKNNGNSLIARQLIDEGAFPDTPGIGCKVNH